MCRVLALLFCFLGTPAVAQNQYLQIGPGPSQFIGGSITNPLILSGAAVVYPFNGTSFTQPPINTSGGILITGTAGNVGYAGIGFDFNVTTINNASANSTGQLTVGRAFGQYATGAQGGLTGFTDLLTIQSGQTLSDTSVREFVAGRDFVSINSNSNGQLHSIIGRTISQTLGASASGYGGFGGQEIALTATTGSSAVNKYGQYILLGASDAVRGSSTNHALGFWNQYAQGASNGWTTLIDLGPGGQSGLFFPAGQDATLIKVTKGATDGSLTVASVFDWSALSTITGNQLNGVNFSVAGPTGAVTTPGLISGGTKFTITGCSAGTTVGGSSAGTFLSGTTGACSVVITLNGATGLTAPNGWSCSANDLTTPANLISQSASTATTCTVTGTTISGDKIAFQAQAF